MATIGYGEIEMVEAVGIEPLQASGTDPVHGSSTDGADTTQILTDSDIAADGDFLKKDRSDTHPGQDSDRSLHENHALFRTDSEYVESLIGAVTKSDMTGDDKTAILTILRAVRRRAME